MTTSSDYVQLCGYHDHPNANSNGVIYEHRLVMSQYLGRALKKGEVVHHRNGDPKDNRLENLELTVQSEHINEHRPPVTMIKLECAWCGTSFEREARQVRTKQKHGQKDFYCNKSCGASNYGRGRTKTPGSPRG